MLNSILKSKDITLPTKVRIVEAIIFPVVTYRCERYIIKKTAAAAAQSLQSCPTLCNPIDGSPPGTPSLGIFRQEHWSQSQRIDIFKLWCWRRLLRILWTGRRSNQSILKKINTEYSLEGLLLKLKLQYLAT